MPPSKSPALNFGVIRLRIIRAASTSGSVPSSPYPTSMRILRSFGTTSTRTPLSLPFCPIFHASKTRVAYSSTLSPPIEGTVSTTTWLVVLSSWAFDIATIRSRAAGDRISASSTTRPDRYGISAAGTAAAQSHSTAKRAVRALKAKLTRRAPREAGRAGRSSFDRRRQTRCAPGALGARQAPPPPNRPCRPRAARPSLGQRPLPTRSQ